LPLARRRFLGGALGTVLAAGPLRAAAAPAETIAVLGGGLAGLAAALRLREAGKRVIVLEARPVPGGRVRTERAAFGPGLYAELGPARIADTHAYVLHWLGEMNLSLEDFTPPSGADIVVLDGMRTRSDDAAGRARLTAGLARDERGLSPAALLQKYLRGLPDDLASPDLDLTQARWAEYDRMAWPQWLAARGASKPAIALMMLGGDSSRFSALYMLRQILLHRDVRNYFKIAGGMDRLPRAMAAALGHDIRYDCEVTRIARNQSGVRILCRQGGRDETIAADRALIALPFSILRRVAVDPPFLPAKKSAIANLAYYEATRFLIETDTRFWEAQHLTGGARTDGPADIWDMSYGQKSPFGLLSLTTGEGVMERRIEALSDEGRRALGLALAKPAFPELATHMRAMRIQRWTEDVYARGAFTVFYPGQMGAWSSLIARPEGRVHFAGEHASPWTGWMEGALWSAERAVQEILQS
jgi:monoamine oxidase